MHLPRCWRDRVAQGEAFDLIAKHSGKLSVQAILGRALAVLYAIDSPSKSDLERVRALAPATALANLDLKMEEALLEERRGWTTTALCCCCGPSSGTNRRTCSQ